MIKNELRHHLKEKRRALPAGLYAEKSKLIGEQLKHLSEYKDAHSVLFYVSTPEEVHTHELIKEALAEGKLVYVPKILDEQMFICPLYDFEELVLGEYGILEPGANAGSEEFIRFDVIVVPGVGFDHHGNRLGRGKGFYDRLLKETKGYKVGLAFEEQLVPELPTQAHDIPMDTLITDQNLLFFTHS